jgi:DNA invertase Pin-like site-specific DNA recombinase
MRWPSWSRWEWRLLACGITRDLSTPSGRLLFQLVGAMAEFERALIQERVRAGLASAKKKGRRLGRPKVPVDVSKIAALRAQGRSWASIGDELGIGETTARRAGMASAKNLPKSGLITPTLSARD